MCKYVWANRGVELCGLKWKRGECGTRVCVGGVELGLD